MSSTPAESGYQARSPVELLDTGSPHKYPAPGIALCLSGGGYRAMLFHLGTLWRLHELGYLAKLDRISSVSGGSIVAAALALKWNSTVQGEKKIGGFEREVVSPVRNLAGKTIDIPAVLVGMLPFVSVSGRIARAYQKHLLGDATLQNLPDHPRFVINSTNLQSGALWRFMKPYMRDYRVGEIKSSSLPLAVAVAASSAFPPFLSPVRLRFPPSVFTPGSGKDLQREPYTANVMLSDGGVYDNLGLETAWKRFDTILVSDAGGKMGAEPRPKRDWLRHIVRVLLVTDNQVRSLRKRQVIEAFRERTRMLKEGEPETSDAFRLFTRAGAYWCIRTNIRNYDLDSALECPFQKTMELANVPTRLARLDDRTQERLINWGYAVCDAAVRKHVDTHVSEPPKFPYDGGVG